MAFEEIRNRYAGHFGVAAGYLPSRIEGVADWHGRLTEQVELEACPPQSSVVDLRTLLDSDHQLRSAVQKMIDEALSNYPSGTPPEKKIHTIPQMLAMMDCIVANGIPYVPPYTDYRPNDQNFFPMSSLFVYMMYTQTGWDVFRHGPFNDAIRAVLQQWMRLLDSHETQHFVNFVDGWLSPPAWKQYKLDEFVIDKNDPHGGFGCFNAWFHRQIKLDQRPLAGPDDPKVIVSANDGTVWRIAEHVQLDAPFWTKDQPYALRHVLNGNYLEAFDGGSVFQAFLSGANYHRWRAPVAGTIAYTEVVDGLMFSELLSLPFDSSAGTLSQGYQANVNTRGLIFITADDPAIGMVCVIPIGITEISSVTINVTPGDHVEKGDELGWFSYGGSTLALVFQKDVINRWRWDWPPSNPCDAPAIDVRDWIAVAN